MNNKNKKMVLVCGVLLSLAVALQVMTSFIGNEETLNDTQNQTQESTEKENVEIDDILDIVVDPIIIPNLQEPSNGTTTQNGVTSGVENNIIVDKDDFEIPPIDIPQISIDNAQNIINSNNETYSPDGLTIYQELQPTPTVPDESTNSNNNSGSSTNGNNNSSSGNNNSSSGNNNSSTSSGSSNNSNQTPSNGHINENGEKYVEGFGYIPLGDGNVQNNANDMYQNGNKVGIM